MRIAGLVPRSHNLEVEFIKSVHTVSRWVHEMFQPMDGSPGIPTNPPPPIDDARAPRRPRA